MIPVLDLPASPLRVFRALTEPRELNQWYSSHAELAAVPGGTGRFEGKDGQFLETWRVEALDAPRRLVVIWSNDADWYEGALVRVELVLESTTTGCRLVPTLTALGGTAAGCAAAGEEWVVALGRLSARLRAEQAVLEDLQCVRSEVRLPVGVAEAWTALTDPIRLQEWFWTTVDMQANPGHVCRFGVPGQLEPDQGLVQTVEPEASIGFEWRSGDHRTAVRWALSAAPVDADASRRVPPETTWVVTDGPYRAENRWRRAVCDVGWHCVQQSLLAWFSTPAVRWDHAAWLEGLGYREEFSVPIEAERAWSLLSDPVEVARWLGGRAGWTHEPSPALLLDGIEGGRRAVSLLMVPHQRLVLRWLSGRLQTIVSIRLIATDTGTTLRLHHWGFAAAAEQRATEQAWWQARWQALQSQLQPPPQPSPEPGHADVIVI